MEGDPGQQNDIAGAHPEITARLAAEYDAIENARGRVLDLMAVRLDRRAAR